MESNKINFVKSQNVIFRRRNDQISKITMVIGLFQFTLRELVPISILAAEMIRYMKGNKHEENMYV